MQSKETIKVYIDYRNGETKCICKRSHKLCDKHCVKDVVERDKFRGWQEAFKVNRYGKSRLDGERQDDD